MSSDAPKGLSAHDFPFRLIDRVSLHGPDEAAGVYGLSADGFLQDDRSDPGRPWPAALIVEAMLQAALPLAPGEGSASPQASFPGFVGAMEGVRLHAPARAGDRLAITARVVGRHAALVRIACRAVLEDRPAVVVAEGEFTVSWSPAAGRGNGRDDGEPAPVDR